MTESSDLFKIELMEEKENRGLANIYLNQIRHCTSTRSSTDQSDLLLFSALLSHCPIQG